MRQQTDLWQAVERVPGWSSNDTRVEARLAGLSNKSFRVLHRGERFVLRLSDVSAVDPSRDRNAEAAIHRRAAKAGFAPEIVYADPEAGILVTRYLEGQTLQVSNLDETHVAVSIAKLLRNVHAMPLTGHVFDRVGAARRYASLILRNGASRADLSEAERCVEVIERLPAASSLRCCHNDVVADNLHCGYDRYRNRCLRLLDWEYAADNDPYFDLASLSAYHTLSDDTRWRLLLAYDADAGESEFAHLDAWIRGCDALFWLWHAAR